jgi:hypothetical protein
VQWQSDADMENAVNKAKAAEFIPQLVDLKGRSGYNAQVGFKLDWIAASTSESNALVASSKIRIGASFKNTRA